MKKVIVVIAMCAMAASLAFGEEAKAVKGEYTLKDAESLAMTGVLKLVIPSDLSRPNTGLVMTTDEGRDVEFGVKPSSPVYDGATGALVSLSEIPAGSRIRVNYRDGAAGRLHAMAVKILPKEEVKEVQPQPAPMAVAVPKEKKEEEAIK